RSHQPSAVSCQLSAVSFWTSDDSFCLLPITSENSDESREFQPATDFRLHSLRPNFRIHYGSTNASKSKDISHACRNGPGHSRGGFRPPSLLGCRAAGLSSRQGPSEELAHDA